MRSRWSRLALEHGRMRWRRYNLLRLSFFGVYLALICFVGAAHRARVIWFVAAFLASQLFALLVRLWILRRSLLGGNLRIAPCRQLLAEGAPWQSFNL